jgi:hypothetical protein
MLEGFARKDQCGQGRDSSPNSILIDESGNCRRLPAHACMHACMGVPHRMILCRTLQVVMQRQTSFMCYAVGCWKQRLHWCTLQQFRCRHAQWKQTAALQWK